MQDTSKKVIKLFPNRGLNQRVEPAQLAEGEYLRLVNMTTIQEGALTTRRGRKLLGKLPDTANLPHTIAKFRVDDSTVYRYVGEGADVYRFTDGAEFTKVNPIPLNLGDTLMRRWTSAAYNSGTSGDPYMFFGGTNAMLKDYGRAPYEQLASWGILPPSRPITAQVLTANPVVLVDSVQSVSFSGLDYTNLDLAMTSSSFDLSKFANEVKSGSLQNGYDSPDFIEISITLSATLSIDDIRLRIDVTPGGGYVDYYEKPIAPSSLDPLVQKQEAPFAALTDRTTIVDKGVTGVYTESNPDDPTRGFAPIELQPSDLGVQQILKIRKSDFGKVGRAGNNTDNTRNWSSVVGVRIVAKANDLAAAVTINYVQLTGGAGPDTSVANAVPYKYVYTLRDPQTGAESNPCPIMIENNYVYAERQAVVLTFGGGQGSLITGFGSIAIYRNGGAFTDEFYRFLGYATNPGVSGEDVANTDTFTDTASDVDLQFVTKVAEFDNDPPVSSTLPRTFVASITEITEVSTAPEGGWFDIIVDLSISGIRNGTKATIGQGISAEKVFLFDVGGGFGNGFRVYLQNPHAVGDQVSIEYVTNQPCNFVAQCGDSLFLAGDENNPHILYKSKPGRPDAFPVFDVNGTAYQVNVGSPSNRIMGITEFAGAVLCLNYEKLYIVNILNGQMQQPYETPAHRGLIARYAWCRVDNEIWYLSYDGIYSWSGGGIRKRTEKIDWMFRNKFINGYQPIDLGQVDPDARRYLTMEFHHGHVIFSFHDVVGFTRRLKYYVYAEDGRWEFDESPVTAMCAEQDSGRLICGEYSDTGGIITEDDIEGSAGTSDAFATDAGDDGVPINFLFHTAYYTLGDAARQKLLTEIVIELENPSAEVTIKPHYDFKGPQGSDDSFVIPADPTAGRRRITLAIKESGSPLVPAGQEFYSVAFEIVSESGGTAPTTFYSLQFVYYDLADIQGARITDWMDLGHPYDKRLYELTMEFETPDTAVTLLMDTLSGIDGATVTLAAQTFTLAQGGRTQKTFPITDGIIAKKVRFRAQDTAGKQYKVFGFDFQKENYPPDIVPFTEWDSIGHPHDKRMFVLWLDVDTNNKVIPVNIEYEGGVAQSITVQSTGSTRAKEFAVPIDIIAKKVRLKVGTVPADGKFQLFSHRFEVENYPPDIVKSTDYSDYGDQFDKYLQQLVIDVNTNGQTVPVTIEGESGALQTVNISTTHATRQKNITLNPGLIAKKLRLNVGTIPSGGKFQLFNHNFVYLKADRGPVYHTYDWDDLGTPWDKHLNSITFEYDTGGASITMNMDLLGGVEGGTVTSIAQQFTLQSSGRQVKTFPITTDTIAKMIRIYPASTTATMKTWKYTVNKVDYPRDIVQHTEYDDGNYAHDKYWQQVKISVDTNGYTVPMHVEIDGTDVQTINVVGTFGNRNRNYVLSGSLVGKRARLRVNPADVPAGGKFQLFSWDWVWMKADKGDVYHTYDWNDLGHRQDKHLQSITFEYDTGGVPITLQMDTLNGVNGTTENTNVQQFVLNKSGRAIQTFNITADTIAKMIRIFPLSTTTTMKAWQYTVEKVDYPRDIVHFTEFDDEGYPFEKLYQQITVDADTNGQAVTVAIEGDSGTLQQITVTGTFGNRESQITLNPSLVSRKTRLKVITVPNGGKFQLFGFHFKWLQNDRGPTVHSFDWDDLGHPYDKRLQEVTFEYDNGGSPITMVMDTLSGIGGKTITNAVQTFVLNGASRALQTFPINDGIIVKMIRFRPTSTFAALKQWQYKFKRIEYPADDVKFTDWSDLGYKCDKIFRWMTLDVDTAGVAAAVNLQVDGVTRYSFNVTTTTSDRMRIITFPSDIIGKLVRLTISSGNGGKFQLFDAKYEVIKEPCAIWHWDSYEQSFGSDGWKFIKQMWVEYACPVQIVVSIYVDNDVLFHQVTLPAHAHRDVERFYLPTISNSGVLNKSKMYRFVVDPVDSTTQMKLYRDATRVESKQMSDDQRSGYSQHYLWEVMPIPV